MTNPVFTRNKVFTQRTPAGYPAMPGYQVGGGTQTLPGQGQYATYQPNPTTQPTQAYPNDPFAAPNAGQQAGYGFPPASNAPTATRPVTLDDVLIKTLLTFGVLLVGGAVSWFTTATNPGLGYAMMFGGMIVALILGLVNSFKRRPSPALILGYAFFEGLMLGSISQLYSTLAGGVVPKAIGATIVTTLVMLVLFKTKTIRNSPTLMRVVFIGMGSLFVFYLLNFVISMIFPAANFYNVTLFGFPLWVVVSLVAIVLAALSLVTDFDFIMRAVENRAPAETAWTAAFGLMVTLVWLYLEFLRLFALFASSDN
ncbi:MAG: Bax inhibitor-1/YccA family protein [Mobiluncus sp.]|uniref:Bax inhibitor-1/YccA family protein n=1 Tax=Mobiluncus sp. TaxID=47293 RepID=UPI0025840341|nr:Bax inhibitor-1/YccA family protein [Mobiluncus sp.]MCI6584983.1 Bax inhibitor-1/YccA family protein [Mobiluncus sp.]